MGFDVIQKIDEQTTQLKDRTAALKADNAARAAYIARWQAEHEIRNLMSRFAMYYSAGQFTRAAALFSDTEQVYLQASDVGIYEGKAAIESYFGQLEKNNLPGSFRVMLLTSEIIELAGDCESAQGMWFDNGLAAIKDSQHPDAPAADLWINDKVAVEFIKEEGRWVILRLNLNEEMRGLYHLSWGEYAETPAYPAFDTFAVPTRPATRHMPFAADRKSGKNLTTPEPYASYGDLADHF